MSTFSVSGPKILSHIMPRSADDDTVSTYFKEVLKLKQSSLKSYEHSIKITFSDISDNLLSAVKDL